MTFIEREQIFAKDYITTQELKDLLGYANLPSASAKMSEIKRVVGDRLGVKGKIHVEDYLAYFKIKTDRYLKPVV